MNSELGHRKKFQWEKKQMKRPLSVLCAFGFMIGATFTASAQESDAYPTRPVTLVVQATAGGGQRRDCEDIRSANADLSRPAYHR